jgi:hypothetical protein
MDEFKINAVRQVGLPKQLAKGNFWPDPDVKLALV